MDSAKVWIRRKKDADPVTCVTVPKDDGFHHWQPDPAQNEFEVDALTAAAAVETGGFEVKPESKVKLKEGGD
ncbi:MAG: hypothetical protein AB1631_33090 [Acidobacteriota bacterium]